MKPLRAEINIGLLEQKRGGQVTYRLFNPVLGVIKTSFSLPLSCVQLHRFSPHMPPLRDQGPDWARMSSMVLNEICHGLGDAS
jgi:hypothetical protein